MAGRLSAILRSSQAGSYHQRGTGAPTIECEFDRPMAGLRNAAGAVAGTPCDACQTRQVDTQALKSARCRRPGIAANIIDSALVRPAAIHIPVIVPEQRK